MVLELDVLDIARKFLVPYTLTVCKKELIKKKKKKKNCLGVAQNPIDHNMVDRNFKD